MTQKDPRRARSARKRSALPALMLLCMAFLALQGRIYGLEPDVYRGLLGLQLPFLYALRPVPSPPPPQPVQPIEPSIDENVGEPFRIELKRIESAEEVDLSGSAPRILIYHTHTTEAYRETPGHTYEASGDWRTHDNTQNIVAVGEKLASLLREKYGLAVLHDTTDHEPPKLSTSYSRSVLTMQAYKEKYPSLTMFIDVHRDAYGAAGGAQDYVTPNGKPCARIMFVVGTGEGATGNGFKEMPDFRSNYALAAAVTQRLRAVDSGLARDIRVKTGRYNQHIANQCLLAEVGHNQNTLEQALNATEYLAAAIADAAGVADAREVIPQWTPLHTPQP